MPVIRERQSDARGGTATTNERRISWLEAMLLVGLMFWIGVLNHLILAVTMLVTVIAIVVPVMIVYPTWEGAKFIKEHWVTVSVTISAIGALISPVSNKPFRVDSRRLTLQRLKS